MGVFDLLKRQFAALRTPTGATVESDETAIDGENTFSIKEREVVNQDTLIATKSIRTYKEMEETDAQVRAAFFLKKVATLSVPWNVHPAELPKDADEAEQEEAQRQADFTLEVFEGMTGTVKTMLSKMLNGCRDGFSVSEKVYKVMDRGDFEGFIGLKAIRNHAAEHFRFRSDEHGNIIEMWQNVNFGNAGFLDLSKFVIYSHNRDNDDGVSVYGRSDFRPAYRHYVSNKFNNRHWDLSLEKYAMPTPVGLVNQNETPTFRNRFKSIIERIQGATSIVLPVADPTKPMPIHLLESSKGTEAAYLAKLDHNNKMINRAILLGGDLATSGGDTVGSNALGEVHFNVLLIALTWLQEAMEETVMNEQIIAPLIDMNFSTPYYPRFKFESLVKDNQEMKARVLTQLVTGGLVNKDEEWVREWINLPEKSEEIKEQEEEMRANLPIPPAPDGNKPTDEDPKETPDDDDEAQAGEFNSDAEKLLFANGRKKKTAAEEKVNFAEIAETLDDAESKAITELSAIVKTMGQKFIASVERQNIVTDNNTGAIRKLKLVGVGDVKSVFQDHMLDLFTTGAADVRRELGSVKMSASIEGSALKKMLRDKSFYISGVLNDKLLADANGILYRGINGGASQKVVVKNLNDLFEKAAGDSSMLKDGKTFTPSRLETIVRTNFNGAYNDGRRDVLLDDDLKDFVKGVQFSAIMDSRTTAVCQHLDNKTFKNTDTDGIEANSPPRHYNCRSQWVPVTLEEAEKDPFTPITAKQKARAQSLAPEKFRTESG
ncbi:DUF935 family protein [bacterium]|nr:DUF935 family protein [bacterium]